MCSLMCFFQAEDGIRDLVRSRGLGDVYKRQAQAQVANDRAGAQVEVVGDQLHQLLCRIWAGAEPVSYTHLTLPTSDLV